MIDASRARGYCTEDKYLRYFASPHIHIEALGTRSRFNLNCGDVRYQQELKRLKHELSSLRNV